MKRSICILLALLMILSLAACGAGSTSEGAKAGTEAEAKAETEAPAELKLPAINEITLSHKDESGNIVTGDFADITATVHVLTNRTDIVDTTYAEYAAMFHELYPNITVEYEALTDYEEGLNLRLPNGDWGDICFIPTSVVKSDMSTYFAPLGSLDTLDSIYNFASDKSFGGTVYGIANGGNADGIAYNKAVWEAAGITELPTTPDEFLDCLQKIKDNTDAIPLYTNFAATWTMGAWDAYIWVAATGDPDFRNNIVHTANPFSNRGDGTGPYAVYYCLYEAVARGLIEEDPMSTDWESSKNRINNGEIATMVLGSWSVQQFRDAGDHPEDVCYMPFPIYVTDENGNRVTSAGGNYSYAINGKTSTEQQIAAMVYLKWLLEESPIYTDEGCIPALKTGAMPDFLEDFAGIELLSNNPAPAGEENLFDEVNNLSECGLNSSDYPDCMIVEDAMQGKKTLDDIMDEWNEKWSAAQKELNVEILY